MAEGFLQSGRWTTKPQPDMGRIAKAVARNQQDSVRSRETTAEIFNVLDVAEADKGGDAAARAHPLNQLSLLVHPVSQNFQVSTSLRQANAQNIIRLFDCSCGDEFDQRRQIERSVV